MDLDDEELYVTRREKGLLKDDNKKDNKENKIEKTNEECNKKSAAVN